MKHGFIKVATASPKISVAHPTANAEAIIRACRVADEKGVKLVVFPELSVTGATCGDLFLHKTLTDAAETAILHIADETEAMDMAIVVGAPIRCEQKLYNCAVVLHRGNIVGVVPKTNLSVDEMRRFTPAPRVSPVRCSAKIGEQYVLFGTDMLFSPESLPTFTFAAEVGADHYAPIPPSARHAEVGATVICVPSASYEAVGRAELRRINVMSQSARLHCALILCEAGYGESTTDFVFAGHQLIAENGRLLAESKPFSETECPMCITEIDVDKLYEERLRTQSFREDAGTYMQLSLDMEITDTKLTRKFDRMPFVPEADADRRARCEAILDMQSHGLKKRLEHTHAKCAVIGISGGLDSCLALLVAVRTMDLLDRPRTDVIAVTMPCFGTTRRTRSNAEILCERLGVSFRCVDIKAAVHQHFADIGHDESDHNVVYENVQARERTQVIMDIANAEGGMVIGTGDLSELALGWATYNGDHMSMYGVNASVPKTLIRHIVRTYADNCGDAKLSEVLLDILDTPVSPELLPADDKGEIAQRTEDLVGPYELHDFYLYWFLRHRFTPEKIERMANYVFEGVYDAETIHKWLAIFLRRFMNQQFKRSCLPDGVKVGSVGVSPRGDLMMPSDAISAEWMF